MILVATIIILSWIVLDLFFDIKKNRSINQLIESANQLKSELKCTTELVEEVKNYDAVQDRSQVTSTSPFDLKNLVLISSQAIYSKTMRYTYYDLNKALFVVKNSQTEFEISGISIKRKEFINLLEMKKYDYDVFFNLTNRQSYNDKYIS